jgi:ribonuclease R
MKKIEYMAQFVGEEFTGVISGVTAFGIFVELDNGVEGLVHVSTMTNDYYEYVEEQYAMIGERTRTQYRLGDEVEVILARANVEERNLDFVLKDNGQYVPERPAKPGNNSKQGKGDKKAKAPRPKKQVKPLLEDELIAEPMLTEEETRQKEQKTARRRHGNKKRGASGEKLPQTEKRENEGRKPRAERKRRPGKAESADKESRMGAGSFRGENRRNREERRSDKEAGYHRVYVTGLNSAVWPDPPGYHEKKEREMAAAAAKAEKEKSKKSRGSRRPRPHRKTEGGTGNSK